MREILFRGKNSDDEWAYGWLGHLHCSNPYTKQISSIYFTEISNDFKSRLNTIVDYKTVGQFTGLTDKNGIKIFEGDICKGAWGTMFQVVYDDCYLGFRAKEKTGIHNCLDYYGLDRLEVIGNIHDNPELLETA